MPYYSCADCKVLHHHGEEPTECSVCGHDQLIAAFNINQ